MLALRNHIESVTDGDDDVIVPTGKSRERREGRGDGRIMMVMW